MSKPKMPPNADLRLIVIAFVGDKTFNRDNIDRAIEQAHEAFEMTPYQTIRMDSYFDWV